MGKTLSVLWLAAQAFAYTCVMESVAVNLAPGSWAEMPTAGLTTALIKNQANMHAIFNYADEGVWDSIGREVLFYGRGHGGITEDTRFIAYNAASNAWRREPRSTMFEIGHSYDHHAVDQANRVMYYHPTETELYVYKYDLATKVWSFFSLIPANIATGSVVSCCIALEYFPEKNCLVMCNGGDRAIYINDIATRRWTAKKYYTMGGYHNFAKYSPVHKCVYFGGGEGSQGFYRYDTAGKVDTLARSPVVFAIASSVHACDPVTGDFLVWEKAGAFYRYDDASNTWALIGTSAPFFHLPGNYPDDNAVFNTVAVPINTWGVILTATYSTIEPKVFLYKHARTSAIEKTACDGAAGPALSVFPNPFNPSTTMHYHLGRDESGSLGIFNARGARVRGFKLDGPSGSVSWDGADRAGRPLPPGIYFTRLSAEKGKSITMKVFYLK